MTDETRDDTAVKTEPHPLARAVRPQCPECGRTFNLLDDTDAAEWAYGHDCEDIT